VSPTGVVPPILLSASSSKTLRSVSSG
jgi:hypothetical protein